MERSTRLFASRILLTHGVAFVALLIVTGAGVWEAYTTAQQRSFEDAGSRLRAVAQQTARGIENYYGSILESVQLITREEMTGLLPAPASAPAPPRPIFTDDRIGRMSAGPATSPASTRPEDGADEAGGAAWRIYERGRRPATRPDGDRRGAIDLRSGGERLATTALLTAVWRQIETRATHLIAVRTDSLRVLRAERRPGVPDAEAIVAAAAPWLTRADAPAISGRFVVGDFAFTLVGVRFASNDPLIVAAVVPLGEIDARFIEAVQNKKQTINAALIDDSSVVLCSTDRSMIGANLERDAIDPATRRLVRLDRAPISGYEAIEPIVLSDGRSTPRSIRATDPVRLLEGKPWMVTVSTPLADVGGIVNDLFRGTLLWAPILILLFAGVVVSTAVTLIRFRSRLERVRHHALQKELTQARHIQLSWLPKPTFVADNVRIAALNEPASHVSGDFYNYFALADGRIALVIGDVTGHGMAAAFLMATTQLIVRLLLKRTGDPAVTMSEANRALCEQVYSGQFVTLQILLLDRRAGSLQIVNAGHPPPILVHGDAAAPLDVPQQIVLGVDEEASYGVTSIVLPDECALLLYTDGIVECRAPDGSRFSIPMLVDAMRESPTGAQPLLDRVSQIVSDFRRGEPLDDDTSVVAVEFHRRASASAPAAVATAPSAPGLGV